MHRSWLVGLVAVVVAGCALGCAGKARVQRRPGSSYLAEIRIDGNRAVEDDDLIGTLALQRTRERGRSVDPYQLSLDTSRIRQVYLRLGYFSVRVDSRIEEGQGGAQTAVFTVTEGPRATMEVVIKGLPPEVPLARARALIETPDGGPFDYDVYDEARAPLSALVESAGYAHVQLEAYVSAERTKAKALAIYELSPGEPCTFGAVTLDGATGVLAEAIGHRIAFREGERYSPAALAATQRALYELGRFSTVLVAPQRVVGQTVIPVKITVSLASRHELRFGGGFGREPLTYEARLRAGGSYVPLASPLWTLAADARLAGTVNHNFDWGSFQPKLRLLATAQRTDLIWPRVGGELAAGYDFVAIEAYTSTGPRLRLGVSVPLGVRWLTARVGWEFSYLRFSNPREEIAADPATLRELFHIDDPALLDKAPQRLGAYQAILAADLRDDPLDPKRGVFVAVRASQGTRFAGSALSYTQLAPDLRGYLALGSPRFVLAVRLRGGAILGDVPATERYYSGGAQGHRGFSERRLSPSRPSFNADEAPIPIGGAALLETGAELRIGLGELFSLPLGATLFLDGGDVVERPEDLHIQHLHWAAGLGLSVRVAGVKVRIDAGYRLNRQDSTEFLKNTAFHFGLGDSF